MAKTGINVGPWTLQFGSNTITDVTEISFNYDVATNDYDTVQGDNYSFDGNITSSVDLTLLKTDVAALRVVLPQYYVEPGGTLSTGETVSDESGSEGAIDIVAAQCGDEEIVYPLTITSCTGNVIRIPNAKASLSGIDIDGAGAATVTISFRRMPATEAGVQYGAVQMFEEGAISEES